MNDITKQPEDTLPQEESNSTAVDQSVVSAIKNDVVEAALKVVLDKEVLDTPIYESLKEQLIESLSGEATEDFISRFVRDTERLVNSFNNPEANFYGFITYALENVEVNGEDTAYVKDIMTAIADIDDDNNMVLSGSVGDGWSEELVGRNVQLVDDDETAVLLWLHKRGAIALYGKEDKALAASLSFSKDGNYVASYIEPEVSKVLGYISAVIHDEYKTFGFKKPNERPEPIKADTLTVEKFAVLAGRDNEFYKQLKEDGRSEFDAIYGSGVEAWADENGIDLSTSGIEVVHQDAIVEYIKNEYDIPLPWEVDEEAVEDGKSVEVDEVEPVEQDIPSDEDITDAEIVEDAEVEEEDPFTKAETNDSDELVSAEAEYVSKHIKDLLDKSIKAVVDDDGKMLAIAADTDTSPKAAFINTIMNRVKALSKEPIDNAASRYIKEKLTEQFKVSLPRLDKLLENHRAHINSLKLEPNADLISEIISKSPVHALGVSKLSDEHKEELINAVVADSNLTGYNKDEREAFDLAVEDILGSVAPYDYDVEVLTDPVYATHKEHEINEDGKPFRVNYIANVLRREYTKVPSTEVNLDKKLLLTITSQGPSSSLFNIEQEKLESLIKALPDAKTYAVSNGFTVMNVMKREQTVDDELGKQYLHLFSVADTNYANNIVIIENINPEGRVSYTLTSSTGYKGIGDVSKYVKDILI